MMTLYTKVPSAQRCILDKPIYVCTYVHIPFGTFEQSHNMLKVMLVSTWIWLMYYKNFFISFQLIGSMIIGYMAWILATSVTVSRFLEGSLVSYVIYFIYFAQVSL